MSAQKLFVFLFASIAAVCAALWFGAQVEIFRLKEAAQKMIGRVLIGAALAALCLRSNGLSLD
jgi:hypothetical protein